MKTLVKALALALLAVPSAGTTRTGSAAPAADAAMHVEGSGAVTVVFESGLGDTGHAWDSVQAAIADHCATTVSYTRNGYGGARRAATGPRDAERIVTELRARLAASGHGPPYVLVGHSLGGLYMQYFARRHPAEVRGLVLVDSMHADQLEQVVAVTPGVHRATNLVTMLRGGIMRREFLGVRSTAAEISALPTPAQLPTIVLSGTRAGVGEPAAFRRLAARLQDRLAMDYAARRHEFVPGSGHYIQRDRPDVVIGAVRELVGCGAASTSMASNHRGSHVAAR